MTVIDWARLLRCTECGEREADCRGERGGVANRPSERYPLLVRSKAGGGAYRGTCTAFS
jgi:hypothetical protein